MDARDTIKKYYTALRAGEPLDPYFAEECTDDDAYVKFGISERLVGSEQIQTGLQTQTETTIDWEITSHDLRVIQRDRHAWFSDMVLMAWTHTESGRNHEFETRWSGTLTRHKDLWRFVGIHVSTADNL